MRISDAVRIDPETRRMQKAKSLLATINRRLDFYHKRMQDRLTLGHLTRATHASAELRRYLEREEYRAKNTSGEINSSLSSWQMINNSVEATLTTIFTTLPPPTKRQYNEYEQAVITNMTNTGRTMMAAQYKTELLYEIAYRATHNYFILFNTLTVTNKLLTPVFTQNSTYFKEYLRRFTRALPGTERDNKDHSYFAVVEEGGKTARLHIHVIHFFPELPPQAQDPNKARHTPNHRQVDFFRSLWPHAFSTPIAVRWSPQDPWGQQHWRWPIDSRTQQPLLVQSPLRLASYMAKYINKSYSSPRREAYQWRIRKSRNLGTPILEQLLSTCTPQDLLNIATNDAITTKLNNRRVPPNLLRQAALRQYQKDQNHRFTGANKPSLVTMASNVPTRPSPLHASRDSIQQTRQNNRRSIGLTRITTTNDTDDSEQSFAETIAKLDEQAKILNAKYFWEPSGTWGTTSTHDHMF